MSGDSGRECVGGAAELNGVAPKTMRSPEQLHSSLAAVSMRGGLSSLTVHGRMRVSILSATVSIQPAFLPP